MNINKLKKLQRACRENILLMTTEAGSGHLVGPLGIIDLLIYLFHERMNKKDEFILSCAHMVPALYAVLHSKGEMSYDELLTLRKFKSRLQGHTTKTKSLGIPTAGGSLGQGIGYAAGMAFAKKLKNDKSHVYCLISDGELNEGSVYESLLFINKFKLSNITIILDKNNIQQTGYGDDIMPLPKLKSFFESFSNLNVWECDGNNLEELNMTFGKFNNKKPNILISNTIGGKGIKKLENNQPYHSKVLTREEFNYIINNKEEWTLN